MRTSLLLVGALALAACDATAPDPAASASTSAVGAHAATEADVDGRTLARSRRATARYQNVDRALADGYGPASPCVYLPDGDGNEVAAMGYHYANFDLVDPVVDPAAPEILLYEPMRNGKLRLVGVEFMVPASPDDEGAPTLDGVEFNAHLNPPDPENGIDGDTHGIPFPHYDLHVWTWRNNPDGMFKGHNPKVSCEYAPEEGA